jgi:GT2 family glycosyltransferase
MSVEFSPSAERLPLAAVVVNWNGGDRLLRCVNALLASEPPPVEILVVDNASRDGSARLVEELEGVRILQTGTNLGFAGGANAGAKAASAPLILFMNPDVRVEPDALAHLVAVVGAQERVGVVGPEIRNTDGTLQNRGLVIDPTGHPMGATSDDVFFVSGCALVVRRELFEHLRGFDDDYFMFVEDLDLCWRAQLLGWAVRIVPTAVVFHDGGASLPGGYLTNGRLRTNVARLYLRERNTLAAVLTNYGPARSLTIASARVLMAAVEACIFAAFGRPAASGAYLRALAWVVGHAAPIAAKRRHVQHSRILPDRDLKGIVNRLVKLDVVRSSGLPVVDRKPSASENR